MRNDARQDEDDPRARLRRFEEVYAQAAREGSSVPWARLEPNPLLLDWLRARRVEGRGRRALVVGCGLGDDAEALARAGFAVTGIDLSSTAVAWARRRFPDASIDFQVADLFDPPPGLARSFDLVLESYTLQAIPAEIRAEAMRRVADFVAPGGTLLVITRGREPDEPAEGTPQPLTRAELRPFEEAGLTPVAFDDLRDPASPAARRFRVEYRRAPV
jgi:SAM-dependent methyltransferase